MRSSIASSAALLVLGAASASAAQSRYDFDHLIGTDTHPFTLLDGQDGWSEQTFNAANRCGVTATLSHDGSKSLQFQEVGPGYGCDASRINDASWSFPAFVGTETSAYFQADLRLGFWGGTFGLGYDTNGSGDLRGAQAGELGVRFQAGNQTNVQLALIAADGTATRTPIASAGLTGATWVRIRVVMNLAANGGAGEGTVFVQNLTAGATGFTAAPGLGAIPLGLTPGSNDARNPARWSALWLHFEGATYGLDNVEVGVLSPGANYCAANANSTGQPGTIAATGSASVAQNALTLVTDRLPQNAFGFFLTSMTQGNVQNPGGSQGVLCLSGSIGRYVGPGQIKNSGATGSFSLAVDLTRTPTPAGLVAVLPGQTWNFQAWYRDAVGGVPTSNFTNGLSVAFQ